MKSSNTYKLVIGISGGLDSTLALLVSREACNILNLDSKNVIYGITMPGPGTSDRTLTNSYKLSNSLNINMETISIVDSSLRHMLEIGLDIENNRSITYENCQARYRTMILFNKANKLGALVVGTGDMSELALGWCTYNGDHMSSYAVNCSIPKTLVKSLVNNELEISKRAYKKNDELISVLRDILDTPVSPELLPNQVTEDKLGSYDLQDFFLYYHMRYGFNPEKIYEFAKIAFKGIADSTKIKNTLKIFYSRLFSQQFKRNCIPDGPKIGTISLSPRADLRMPSDSDSSSWMEIVNNLKE